MTSVYQSQQVRDLELLAIQQNLATAFGLMQIAGLAAWHILCKTWPQAHSIVVCCGKGNNAGDGFVLAKLALQAGKKVQVYTLTDIHLLPDAAKRAALECQALGASISPYCYQDKFTADVIVDALLGTGLRGKVENEYLACINQINQSASPVLALDVPSGLDANTGNVLAEAVKATLTITFMSLKQGLLTYKAPEYCGELICDDLRLPSQLYQKISASAETLDWEVVKSYLQKRHRYTHKGDYGHVLVIGGDYGMGGAVRMAAESALRVGAGLVSVATRPEHVSVVSTLRPEIMCHQVTQAMDLEPLLKLANVIVIGPGLGKSDWAKELLDAALQTPQPKVLDADALNLLSKTPQYNDHWILTPHPGEASRLLNVSSQEIQSDRFQSINELQRLYGGVVILKGAGTLVKSEHEIVKICRAGNPGMATGGMGDVLSGVVGGLVAQGLSLAQAAESGVLIHSLAADLAAEKEGERGLLPTDLMIYLRELVNAQ